MFKPKTALQKRVGFLLIFVGLIAVSGFFINRGGEDFSVPIAIGQTHETFQNSDDFQALARANRAFIALVQQTRPAVVKIQTSKEIDIRASDWFRFYFDGPLPRDEEERRHRQRGLGSGVIVSEDGYILTNNHVIEGADEITVTLEDGSEYAAKLIGRDPAGNTVSGTDLAVLKIDAEGLPVLPFGDSDVLEVGEWVIAIGTPLEFSQTVTRGIVSAKGRDGFRSIQYGRFIQTDAPINRGNSGGALINIRGELVGINTLIATGGFTTGNIGIGFAIPSNTAKDILPQLIKDGKVERGWLGISMRDVDKDLAKKLKFDAPRGAFIAAVGRGSPAAKAGLRRADVLIEFDGQAIRDMNHLMHAVGATPVGKSVAVKVLRKGGEEKQFTVTLGKRTEAVITKLDAQREAFAESDDMQHTGFAGLHVQALTPALAERYGYSSSETGVIVMHVAKGSDAEKKGITPGALIQEMEYTPIDTLETYSALVRRLEVSEEKRILLYVKSPNGQGTGYVTLNLELADR